MSCCILVLFIIILMTVEGLAQYCLNILMEVPCYKHNFTLLSIHSPELFRILFLLFQWKINELFSITIDLV